MIKIRVPSASCVSRIVYDSCEQFCREDNDAMTSQSLAIWNRCKTRQKNSRSGEAKVSVLIWKWMGGEVDTWQLPRHITHTGDTTTLFLETMRVGFTLDLLMNVLKMRASLPGRPEPIGNGTPACHGGLRFRYFMPKKICEKYNRAKFKKLVKLRPYSMRSPKLWESPPFYPAKISMHR